MHEAASGLKFEVDVFAGAEAGVDAQDDVEWEFRFAVENLDVLRLAVFGDTEIFLGKSSDRGAALIHHRGEDADQLDVGLEGGGRLLRRVRWCGRSLCVTADSQYQARQQHAEVLHERGIHLDAASRPVVRIFVPVISAGKGSPSAQTAPSSKYSFFQIGTVFLRVSINQRQASKAAARWADATAMKTLLSPISMRPRRWTMRASRTANFWSASAINSSICLSAISS